MTVPAQNNLLLLGIINLALSLKPLSLLGKEYNTINLVTIFSAKQVLFC